jgi:hypothetical protein
MAVTGSVYNFCRPAKAQANSFNAIRIKRFAHFTCYSDSPNLLITMQKLGVIQLNEIKEAQLYSCLRLPAPARFVRRTPGSLCSFETDEKTPAVFAREQQNKQH